VLIVTVAFDKTAESNVILSICTTASFFCWDLSKQQGFFTVTGNVIVSSYVFMVVDHVIVSIMVCHPGEYSCCSNMWFLWNVHPEYN
jgi:hypothetical protein